MRLIKVAVACVNQTPFAWDDNFAHLRMAIEHARAEGATVLCLPELAVTGYGCEDAFFIDGLQDTAFAQLEQLATHTRGMIVAVGLPLYHEKALYNGAALLADGAIIGFVAKQFLAGDGIHYEPRWFKPWPKGEVDELERVAEDGTVRRYPIGDLVFELGDVRIGFEICEDAWVADRPGVDLALRGVDILCNPSASHFAFGKFAVRQRFVIEGSRAFGVGYLYANLLGNEAGRIIYDGGGLIASGGELLARGRRFSFRDVELATAMIDIDGNRRDQARRGSHRPRHDAEEQVVARAFAWPVRSPERPVQLERSWEDRASVREEEFTRCVALGLWDYLRKSRAQGFVISLSGGADSAACAVLVASAVRLAFSELGAGGVRKQLPSCTRVHDVIDKGPRAAIGALLDVRLSTDRTLELAHARGRRSARPRTRCGVSHHRYRCRGQGVHRQPRARGRPGTDVGSRRCRAAEHPGARARAVDLDARESPQRGVVDDVEPLGSRGRLRDDGRGHRGRARAARRDRQDLPALWLSWMETKGPVGLEPVPELRFINTQAPTAELRPAAACADG